MGFGWSNVDSSASSALLSGNECFTKVCTAKEKAALAFGRALGGVRPGKGKRVTVISDRTTKELTSLINPSCSMDFLVNPCLTCSNETRSSSSPSLPSVPYTGTECEANSENYQWHICASSQSLYPSTVGHL